MSSRKIVRMLLKIKGKHAGALLLEGVPYSYASQVDGKAEKFQVTGDSK